MDWWRTLVVRLFGHSRPFDREVVIAVVIAGLSLVNLAFLIRYWRRAF